MPAIVLVQHPAGEWMGADGMAEEKRLVDQLGQLPNTHKVIHRGPTSSGSRSEQQMRMGLLTSFNDPTAKRHPPAQPDRSQSAGARLWLDRSPPSSTRPKRPPPRATYYYLGGLPSVTPLGRPG